MKSTMKMTKEALTDLLQLYVAGLNVSDVKVCNDTDLVEIDLDTDNPEYDGKELSLTFTANNPLSPEVEEDLVELMGEPIVKENYLRLHTIKIVE
jgi:hypothetical protein